MESPAEAAAAAAAAADPSTCTFIQVIFNDIPHSYPPSSPITCRYTLTQAFQSHSRDWVGIFKVGWSTTKDYHTFVWVEPCQDVERQGSVTREAVFKEYYLPKDDIDFYQFCYIDSTGQVRGASTPFCFKKPEGQSMDSSPEDDLLVITTQEQVEQSIREKAELQRELDRMREENEKLKRVVQMERQEATILKWQRDEKEKDKNLLVVELDQVKEQNQNVQSTLEQQLQEMATLKEELLTHRAKQVEIQQQREGALKETEMKEKYDQAMAKISRFIEENKELKGRIDVQSEEIAKLNCKRREDERELLKTKDIILLLQVDVQSSENENERLAAELQRLQSVICKMEDLKSENKELCRRLSEQETGHTDCPDSDLRVECQALVSQLQDAQAMLAAEREESKKAKIHAEVHYRELTSTVKQLETVVASYDMEQQKSNKLELQFREALESIGDKDAVIEEMEHMMRLVKHENEELASENQNLRIEIEGLRRVYSDLHTPPSGEEPDATSPAGNTSTHGWQQQQETPDQTEEPYEPTGSIAGPEEEQSLVCRHCQESFPGITRGELEQHEQSHRVCPFCTMICDNMEQSVFEDHVYSHEL